MNIIGIIPARFASTRLVGKPLADIGGKPMIQHTWEQAKKSKLLNDIYIAVDDQKVFDVVSAFGAKAVMTGQDFQSGSDRIAFVARKLPDADVIVNIQGDEPFIQGRMIDEAIEPFLFDNSVKVSTLVKKITDIKELKSPSIPKVVFDYRNYALYFSRAIIPFVRDAGSTIEMFHSNDFYKHIGLYVYTRKTLLKFTSMKQTDLEKIEKLEQLRLIENGIKIKVVETEYESFSIDTPEDLKKARKFYEKLNQINKH
jgi:3-deoxy-manno-octulosonate cytidylyltransferase (CMP-KDO synthetase)